mgnify:CR=1 FL=1
MSAGADARASTAASSAGPSGERSNQALPPNTRAPRRDQCRVDKVVSARPLSSPAPITSDANCRCCRDGACTAVTGVTSAEFGTVYDVSKYDGSAKTFKRARDAYDSFVGHIEGSIRGVWARQVEVLNGSTGGTKGVQR